MNPNPEQASTQPSAQSRQGPLRDAPARSRSSAEDEGRDLASDARQVASDLADQATRTVERQFTGGKARAAQMIGQFADALRRTNETLSADTNLRMFGNYLGRAAAQVEGLSDYLEGNSLKDVVGDVERFARREPSLFMGGAFLLGLLGGRFLKSSRPGRSTPSGANASQRGERARR